MRKLRLLSSVLALPFVACAVPTSLGAVAVLPPADLVVAPNVAISSPRRLSFSGYVDGMPAYALGDEYVVWDRSGWVVQSQLLKAPSESPMNSEVPPQNGRLVKPLKRPSVPAEFWQ